MSQESLPRVLNNDPPPLAIQGGEAA
jgi:hypothetical protein